MSKLATEPVVRKEQYNDFGGSGLTTKITTTTNSKLPMTMINPIAKHSSTQSIQKMDTITRMLEEVDSNMRSKQQETVDRLNEDL